MFYKGSCIMTRIADKLAQKATEKGTSIQVDVETPPEWKSKTQRWLQKAEVEVSMCQNCFGCLVIFEDDVLLDIVFIIVHVLTGGKLKHKLDCIHSQL